MKNLRFLPILVAFILISFSGAAQSSVLWKITGNGIEKPSYLFGTIHIICADDYLLSDEALKAFSQAQRLVVEVDISDPATIQKAQMLSVNPNYRNIKADLDEKDQLLIDSCLKADLHVGLDQLGIIKPWAIMMAWSVQTAIGCDQKRQYEEDFLKMAKESGKPVGQLETIEYQMSIFDSIPYKRQLDMLVKAFKEKEIGKKDFAEMVSAYKRQDLSEIHRLMMDDDEMKEFGNLFFFQRNRNWISVIRALTAGESVFFAFGAGHLAGEGGVIELLRNEGFTVEPIL